MYAGRLVSHLRCFPIPFKRRPRQDTDISELKNKPEHQFTLNEGVPVEHHSAKELPRASSFKYRKAKPLRMTTEHLLSHLILTGSFLALNFLIKNKIKPMLATSTRTQILFKETFENFSIPVDMEGANIGPRVTQYTLKPPAGIKLSKIAALDRELSLNLAAQSIRIEAPIPGKKAVGIEVPNVKAATVRVSSVITSKEWTSLVSPLGFIIGKDIGGQPVVASLDKMPHLLVAGQTNSGKLVTVNTLLTSLLYKNSPSDLKLEIGLTRC